MDYTLSLGAKHIVVIAVEINVAACKVKYVLDTYSNSSIKSKYPSDK